ncbi:unnamed protein product [marine sediment metagenome]|uniref:Uncharacterized protein n=1 Tax=marine sediment metagenome TaxID=412755 RepID=X1H323_9ZZZZ
MPKVPIRRPEAHIKSIPFKILTYKNTGVYIADKGHEYVLRT